MSLWNFTIPNTSPTLSYFPYADGFGMQNGWQTWYATSSFNAKPGLVPQGALFHVTTLPGARVTLQFYGSSVYLYGTANSTYEVTFDDVVESFSPTNFLLYSKEGLIEENHSVTLTSKPESNKTELLGFGRAVVSISDRNSPSETFYDNSDSALVYSGQWSNTTVQGIPNATVTAPLHQTHAAGSSVTMNFSSAVAVALNASTNFGHGLYSVSIDNGEPQIYNASTLLLATNTVIFFQSELDPERMHTLNATNLSDGANFTLSSVVVYQVDDPTTSGTSAKSHTKVGVIVGVVVAPLVLVLIAASAFVWLRLRQSRATRTGTISPLILSPQRPDQATSNMRQIGTREKTDA
ncbi:hypothetical protein C8R44DRAFT_748331 [Mycena epipterygia]|nr:hypothetical protein C8R44DRAFT_748331 [Mycena epipterygia]